MAKSLTLPSLIDTRSYYILIKNRLCHVREHCIIRWCIFHMTLCNTIQHTDVLEYPLFIHTPICLTYLFFSLLWQPSYFRRCMHLTLIFGCTVRVGQSGSLVYIIKGLRCVFLVFNWWKYIIMKLWRVVAEQKCINSSWLALVQSTGWVCLTLQILPVLPVYTGEEAKLVCLCGDQIRVYISSVWNHHSQLFC